MAKIIGEHDCIGTIKYNFLGNGVGDIDSFDDVKKFREIHTLDSQNNRYYFGALGEEKVINTLRALPDTYYILNEIHIRLTKSVLWKKYFEYVKSA